MNPNQDIYPSAYGATLTAENDRVEWSYPISHLNFLDKLPFEQPWDGSNSYIGFDPTINDCYVGAAKHTVMRLNPEDKKQATVENTTYKKKINYRLLMMESNSQLRYSPIAASYPIAWTNIISPWFSKFTESSQAITYYNVVAESSGTASLYSAALSNFVNYESYAYAPITKINTDAILLVPQFRYITLTPTYDAQGNITNINTGISWLTYYQLKPEDKSAAGQYYDSELWENGFKDTIDAETGRITQRIIIAGARINDVYYGVNTRNGFGSLSSSLWSDKNLRPSTSQVGLNIIAEYYDENRNAVIYEYPNGVFFSSGNDSILSPVTPWNQFYGNTMVAYTRMNPNDRGYYSSSMDNSGLMCDNNTNDLVKSNTIVLPSNFVSLDEDGSRFEIHNNVNYYYFNSDGTISAYSSYLSSGRQYYTYSDQLPCFPLKDLIATIASFGFFFSDGYTSVTSYILDDPTTFDSHLYRGKFDENGVSDGTWWQGDDIPDDKLDDTDYVPEVPGGGGDEPGTEPDEGDWGTSIIPFSQTTFGSTSFSRFELLNQAGVNELLGKLWAAPQSFWEGLSINKQLAANLSDYILSLRAYPVALNAGNAHNTIYIGASSGIDIQQGLFTPTLVNRIPLGALRISRQYNNFLDYNPYTAASIYLPFCGTVEINPKYLYDAALYLNLFVDCTDGSGVWTLVREGDDGKSFPILLRQCRVGVDIPITGLDTSQMASNIVNATIQTGQHALQTVNKVTGAAAQVGAAIATGGTVGAEGVANLATMGGSIALQGLADATNMAMANKEIPFYTSGSGGAAAAEGNTEPFITLRRPLVSNPSNFAHTVGNLVNKTATISSLNGFTVCRNVDVNGIGQATDKEKAQIKQLMESGIYC